MCLVVATLQVILLSVKNLENAVMVHFEKIYKGPLGVI